jgi:hypothetical protein
MAGGYAPRVTRVYRRQVRKRAEDSVILSLWPVLPLFGENDPSSEFLCLQSEIPRAAYPAPHGEIPLRRPAGRNDLFADFS